VPIVLPEVRIGQSEDRDLYIEHWSKQASRLKARCRKMNVKLSLESFQKARLVNEFAHHVDDILDFLDDVLMPRKLDVHLDHGFEAVRGALWRLLGERRE
jgi:hypothetical protein